MRIGPYELKNNLIVAPMAGVTDRPFRQLCKRLGASMAVSEMVTTRPDLRNSLKTRRRRDHTGEVEPIVVQIAGADPEMMAQAARFNVAEGAQIIDINMGCPAKKVCNKAAGSALMRDEELVARILEAVVAAVGVPVTLKMRTGWDLEHKNGARIAQLAETAGIAALAVHGRTRACAYTGPVEYETIREIKRSVGIPVIANGDADSPQKAKEILDFTGADALMIGRAAQGRPWLFHEIAHYLESGQILPDPEPETVGEILLGHLENLYSFYGEYTGVRVARKHITWYCKTQSGARPFRERVVRVESSKQQKELVHEFFQRSVEGEDLAA